MDELWAVSYTHLWNILERETRQLAIDKDKFEREKLIYKDKVYREARRSMSNAENVKIFFKGEMCIRDRLRIALLALP